MDAYQFSRLQSQIKWLLQDEIMSFNCLSSGLSEQNLKRIASHVEQSIGKSGCVLYTVPLTFVHDENEKGFQRFMEVINLISNVNRLVYRCSSSLINRISTSVTAFQKYNNRWLPSKRRGGVVLFS